MRSDSSLCLYCVVVATLVAILLGSSGCTNVGGLRHLPDLLKMIAPY